MLLLLPTRRAARSSLSASFATCHSSFCQVLLCRTSRMINASYSFPPIPKYHASGTLYVPVSSGARALSAGGTRGTRECPRRPASVSTDVVTAHLSTRLQRSPLTHRATQMTRIRDCGMAEFREPRRRCGLRASRPRSRVARSGGRVQQVAPRRSSKSGRADSRGGTRIFVAAGAGRCG
jgi:hypothetical protein